MGFLEKVCPSSSCFLLPVLLLLSTLFLSFFHGASQHNNTQSIGMIGGGGLISELVMSSLLEESNNITLDNSALVLAADRTNRIDPLNGRKRYKGGWNISNHHYWSSGSWSLGSFCLSSAVFIAVVGESRMAILEQLMGFPFFSCTGCIILYANQGKFHESTTDTLKYVIEQEKIIVDNLQSVSYYLSSAKQVGVDNVFIPSDVQTRIDQIGSKISTSIASLSDRTEKNSDNIHGSLHSIRVSLIVIATVMLLLALLGFLFSLLGMQFLVYILVILGWFLVAGTFILCGIFLLLHNVVADTCVAMDQWVKHPTVHTALDEVFPCVDSATANQTIFETREASYQLASVVNQVITNISNINFSPNFPSVYYNQSGPLMPVLCNPFNPDMTERECSTGEVDLNNAIQVWQNYICQVSAAGICTTVGRVTPTLFNQMAASVNVSYGLYHYGSFLVRLEDCSFARETFAYITSNYCSGLQRYSKWTYVGLVIVSMSVMLSLIVWVAYSRERRHRVYTKHLIDGTSESPSAQNKDLE
ncbi:envelope glycoprotein B [Thalictrum thalictroides]|uniref:Envelope glycoprotein B n=1 Tax=Thalictrum thalictroides TaxID=46969 RepID=A0A7J6W4H9_THATH|nr:envelope glycoprotein B [Thalictrum thalictroides]